MFRHNFGKCEPVYKILSPEVSWGNLQCIYSLANSKCPPILLYGLEVCPLNKSDLRSTVRFYCNPPPHETVSNLKQRRYQRMLLLFYIILSSL